MLLFIRPNIKFFDLLRKQSFLYKESTIFSVFFDIIKHLIISH
jgi:hypothetical protein